MHNGERTRDFLYVKDVADAFVHLLNSDVSGAVNIASGEEITIRDIILKIAELLDRSELVQFGSLPTPVDEPEVLVADVKRLNLEVGWSRQRCMLEGLEETISWWRNHLSST